MATPDMIKEAAIDKPLFTAEAQSRSKAKIDRNK
jgi:hypothetical protein